MNDELITPIEEADDFNPAALAKPGCGHCQGRGIMGYNVASNKREEILCSCVMRRVERLERTAAHMEKQQLLNEGK